MLPERKLWLVSCLNRIYVQKQYRVLVLRWWGDGMSEVKSLRPRLRWDVCLCARVWFSKKGKASYITYIATPSLAQSPSPHLHTGRHGSLRSGLHPLGLVGKPDCCRRSGVNRVHHHQLTCIVCIHIMLWFFVCLLSTSLFRCLLTPDHLRCLDSTSHVPLYKGYMYASYSIYVFSTIEYVWLKLQHPILATIVIIL